MIRQNDNEELPIGTQRGCLTITSKRMGYKEYFDKAIQPLIEQCKHEGGAVNWNERTTSVYPPDDVIERYHKNDRYYQCQCKCGQICYMTEWQFLSKRHRYCGSICGRKLAAEKRLQDTYKRVKDEN